MLRCAVLFAALALAPPPAARAADLEAAVRDGVSYLCLLFPPGTRLAVSALRSESPESGAFAAGRLESALVNRRRFTVVERDEEALKALSQEMSYQLSGEVGDETSLSIGRQLGAEIIITGAFVREGQTWRLEVKALRVESAELAGLWSTRDIRPDPSWAALAAAAAASTRRVSLAFEGEELSRRDKQNLAAALRDALRKARLDLELDENALPGAGYGLTVSLYTNLLPPAPPANIALLQGELSIDFSGNGRILLSGGPYTLTETTLPLLLRRAAEKIREDEAFFKKAGEAAR